MAAKFKEPVNCSDGSNSLALTVKVKLLGLAADVDSVVVVVVEVSSLLGRDNSMCINLSAGNHIETKIWYCGLISKMQESSHHSIQDSLSP